MMLFDAGNRTENKTLAAYVLDFRVDLDGNDWQLSGTKDSIRARALDKCHDTCAPFNGWSLLTQFDVTAACMARQMK